MKKSIGLHVLNTWLVAHLFHPFLFLFFALVMGGSGGLDMALLAFVFGVIFSLPALVFLMLVLWMILNSSIEKPGIAMITWLLFALGSVMICCLIFFGGVLEEAFVFELPALVACLVAILIRTKQFEALFSSWRTAAVPDEENNVSAEGDNHQY
ncbi:MAG: hypothetical protein DI535_01045 [Citrobacter freundii]|nr:MAG: hypothetical protein DI535_01045 [Citrobacter freundii]